MSNISWRELETPKDPKILARSSHGVSVVGDTLFMFGGEHSARDPIGTQLHSLDLGADSPSWTEVKVEGSKTPPPRLGHTQAAVGKSIFVFGGRMETSTDEKLMNDLSPSLPHHSILQDLWMFDSDSKAWSEVEAKGNVPSPRSFHSSVVVGECIYVFGGCPAEGRMSDLHMFDTRTKAWKKLASGDKIRGRGGTPMVAAPDGTAIFILGGFAGEETSDVHKYDIAGDKWEEVEKGLPEAISVALCFAVRDKIVMFGGEVTPSERGHAGAGNFSGATTVFSADMAGVVDRRTEGGPPSRGWSAGAKWGSDKVVVVGGLAGDDESPERLMDVWCGQMK